MTNVESPSRVFHSSESAGKSTGNQTQEDKRATGTSSLAMKSFLLEGQAYDGLKHVIFVCVFLALLRLKT